MNRLWLKIYVLAVCVLNIVLMVTVSSSIVVTFNVLAWLGLATIDLVSTVKELNHLNDLLKKNPDHFKIVEKEDRVEFYKNNELVLWDKRKGKEENSAL